MAGLYAPPTSQRPDLREVVAWHHRPMPRDRDDAHGSATALEPSAATRVLRLAAADVDDLRTVRDFVRGGALAFGADEISSADLVQAVDESATNVLLHGYGGTPGPLEIAVERRGTSVAVEML